MISCYAPLIYSKAFDSIDWEFLYYVLQLYGFPNEFLTWFNVIYNDREQLE